MGLKDVFNKGINLISTGASAAKEAAIDKKRAMEEFDLLKTRSNHIGPMSDFIDNNKAPQIGKEQVILKSCLTISVEKSKLTNRLIPIDETVLMVRTSTEAKTQIDYVFALTDKRLWILNEKEYTTYDLDKIPNFEIINKGLMTQGTKFDDKAFTIDGSENDVKAFIRLVMDRDERNAAITRSTAYLCGIVPKVQYLNMNMKGISISEDNVIVIHNAIENKIMKLEDIFSVQILVNDANCYMKSRNESQNFMSSPQEARKISGKFNFNMSEYVIDILAQSALNTSYKREDTTYIENYELAKKIVDTIGNMLRS